MLSFVVIFVILCLFRFEISNNYLKNNSNDNYFKNLSYHYNYYDNGIIEKQIVWKLEIPKINLEGIISEGTDDKNLNKYIGHFEGTPIEKGNICLAAHNRGYSVNYFKELKKLDLGDKIIYKYKNKEMEFEVCDKGIILETDWSKLNETIDTRLTLITCVENKPELRRYVQAKQVN